MNWYKTAQQVWQKGWQDNLGDIQRYIYDAYVARVFITKTARRYTVTISLAHNMFGHVMWQDFWAFDLGEESKARSTFAAVKRETDKVFQQFRTNEIPNPMLHTYLREALRNVDLEHKPTSRIPFIDWAREQDGVADWRSSIYGNRYPTEDIDGF